MGEAAGRSSRGRIIALVAVTAVILAGVVLAVTYLTNGGVTPSGSESPTVPPTATAETTAPADPDGDEDEGDMEPLPTASSFLPEPMGGQDAIDALGDKIEIVAKRNGKTVEELEELLLRDKSARISTEGFVVYIDNGG